LAYLSPAERERLSWRTLAETVAHIVRVDQCQPEHARSQISNALLNGDVWPLRWEDERTLPAGPTGGLTMPPDLPPRRWSEADIGEIDWEIGTAIDRSEYSPPNGRPRRLLIHRSAVEKWWPERQGHPTTEPRSGTYASTAAAAEQPAISTAPTRSQQTKIEAARSWIAEKYPNSIPAGVTVKFLVRALQQETQITVNERTMRRALGRK
jgi:hypothetical protein